MPRVYAVDDVDDERVAMWMEDVRETPQPWSRTDYQTAARALGRLAGRLPEGILPDDVPVGPRDLRGYFWGRVTEGVLPALADDATWAHPLVADAVDGRLRDDLTTLASLAPALLDELDKLPRTLAHGDACPQNLLRPLAEPGVVVAIDWTFAGVCAIGMDAGQLLAGRAESGELDPAQLDSLLDDIITAYIQGLGDEGAEVDDELVRFGVVANLVVRSAFTALPLEALQSADEQTQALFHSRARYARFLVDLGLALSDAIG